MCFVISVCRAVILSSSSSSIIRTNFRNFFPIQPSELFRAMPKVLVWPCSSNSPPEFHRWRTTFPARDRCCRSICPSFSFPLETWKSLPPLLFAYCRVTWLRTKSWRSRASRSEEHTSELQSLTNLVCRLLLGKKGGHLQGPVHLFAARRCHGRHPYAAGEEHSRFIADQLHEPRHA